MRITDIEVIAAQDEYKKNYKPFRPYELDGMQQSQIGAKFASLLKTQNGQDTDDYAMTDDNKVARYLSKFQGVAAGLLIGVGTGREVAELRDLGIDGHGITLGSRNLDYAREYLGLGQYVREGAIEALDFPNETFDIVAGFQTFEHAVAPLLFLLELGRVMKMGGTLLLEWPPANEQFSAGDNPHHQICYTPGQAEALLLKAGFKELKLYYSNMEPIPKEEWWKGDQQHMLVIEGVKRPSTQEYITRAWGLRS